jgi:drug/metabolite transporter (DMT)-like permease
MIRRAAVAGVLFGASLLAAFGSFRTTSIANATLIGVMTPVIVLFLAPRLLGEQVRLARSAPPWCR